MHQENILTFNKFKYLKWSLGLVFSCVLLYLTDLPLQTAGGIDLLGYISGTIGAVLILWLMLFGIRKRAFQSNLGMVRGWLSAHVYLGLSLVFIVTLHGGFNFGLNLQTFTYLLCLIVVATGLWGVAMYLSKPAILNTVLKGKTLEQAGEALIELDRQSQEIAGKLDLAIQRMILRRRKNIQRKHRKIVNRKRKVILTRMYLRKRIIRQRRHVQVVTPKFFGNGLHQTMRMHQSHRCFINLNRQ